MQKASRKTAPADFEEAPLAPIGLVAAIARAREELTMLTQLPLDAVARSERLSEGGWVVVVDMIESAARMGDNDLLATYEVALDDAGDVTRIERVARYRREG